MFSGLSLCFFVYPRFCGAEAEAASSHRRSEAGRQTGAV